MSDETQESTAPQPAQPEPAPVSIPSPCIGICLLDDNGYCIGCGRTTEQIANLPPDAGTS